MSRIKNYMNNRAVAPIAVDTTATVLLAADTNRDCFTIVNDGPETVYLGIGVVPTAGNGVPVYPGCNFEMSFGNFTGDEIQGITAAGASVVFALNNIRGLQNSATGGGGGGAVTPATSLSIEGLSLYRSNIDFAAAFNNVTTLDLTNMTFIPATADILGVMVLTNTGSARELTPHTYDFEYTSTGAATGTLVVTGAGFAATDTFVVIMRGPTRAYVPGTDALRTYEISPVWNQDVCEIFEEAAAADGTHDYYIDMEGYRSFGLQFELNGGSGTAALDISETKQNDGTAPDLCDYVPIGLQRYGRAFWDNTEGPQIPDPIVCVGKYIRISVVADTAGANDAAWIIRVIKGV